MKHTYKYYFRQIDYTLTCVNNIHENPNAVMKVLLASLTRRKYYDKSVIIYNLAETRHCGFCGIEIDKKHRIKYFFLKIENSIYDIVYDSYFADNDIYKQYVCNDSVCKSARSSLNPNSIKFVSIAYRISEEEANEYILKRNKSPFYIHNHTSIEDYTKYQSHLNFTLEQRNSEQRLATYYTNKEKFISEFGEAAWDEKNKIKDSSSFEYFLHKNENNDELAKIEYNDKNIRCTVNSRTPDEHSSEEYILTWWNNRHAVKYNIKNENDFKNVCLKKMINRGPIGKCLFISEINKHIQKDNWNFSGSKSLTFFTIGCYVFKITNLFEFLNIPDEIVRIYNKYNVKMISYVSFIDGYHFRSDTELSFYQIIKKIDSIKIISVNKKYEIHGVNKFYDFKISFINDIYYIEICGGIDENYIESQIYKQKHFNSVLISKRFFVKFANDVANNDIIDITPGAYYDYKFGRKNTISIG